VAPRQSRAAVLMRRLACLHCVIFALACGPAVAEGGGAGAPCSRPVQGSVVPEPVDLHSHNGQLKVELAIRNERVDGMTRFCYVAPDGAQSPTLRLRPGDWLTLRLKNELVDLGGSPPDHEQHRTARKSADPCQSAIMAMTATNLHFHGTTLPASCHQDEVLKTSLQPGDPPFEYRFQIPADEPPGLYWYHPHIHGFSKAQVTAGASGALIVEGLERANPSLAGLAERVIIIRDQDLIHPDAPPAKSEPVVPKMMIDRDGDSANNGTGFGKPARDLSINYVAVPYPDYPPAMIRLKPGERQLWRVLNASAITYLNLALLFNRAPQKLGVVALDGVPLNRNGNPDNAIEWLDHIGLPPGARAEVIVTGPAAGVQGLLVTRTVDTGAGGENDPNRALAWVSADEHAASLRSGLDEVPKPLPNPVLPWLGNVAPVRVRRLFFSEKLQDPNDPNSAMEFYVTVDGETPVAFDPQSSVPNIVVHQGDVEDWIIENRSNELHAFHIHQIHFLLMDWSGIAVNEPFLRDTVNVPYYNGRSATYPAVRLRMDFRDPNTVGMFPYHCHLLEHEDNGMMGLLRVAPAEHAVPW
jgi:FtsP/CotA-like multicopper oxidase with cupredoxin domain